MNKQDVALAIADHLGVEPDATWFSERGKVTYSFQKAIADRVGVPFGELTKVNQMRAILESVAVAWDEERHSSEATANPGGNVTKEAYLDLLVALETLLERCAVTGSTAVAVLEAAHIVPFAEGGPALPANGILMRSDIHTLFDLRLISIDPRTWRLVVHPSLDDTEYAALHGAEIALPARPAERPRREWVGDHFERSGLLV